IELVQHILPVFQPHLLRRRIYFGQAIRHRLGHAFEPGELLQPPFPFFCVDSSQPFVRALRFRDTACATHNCSTEEKHRFHVSSPRSFLFPSSQPRSAKISVRICFPFTATSPSRRVR